MNLHATGTFNGEEGYRMIFRAGDSSEPASFSSDTTRVELFDPDDVKIYDSHWPNEFTD